MSYYSKNGFEVIESRGHGQSVKGGKKSSSIHVIQPSGGGYLLKKSFRYMIGNKEQHQAAIQNAIKYINSLQNLTQ